MPLLDSSFIIDVLRGRENAGRLFRILGQETAPLGTCGHVMFELYRGIAFGSRPEAEQRKIDDILQTLLQFDFTSEAARLAGKISGDLSKRGQTLNPVDLFISATALVHGQTVVTRNKAHFERVTGLQVLSY